MKEWAVHFRGWSSVQVIYKPHKNKFYKTVWFMWIIISVYVAGCTMSSGRESVGDLIPPDMLQVFTEEGQGGRSKRGKRRAASFSRAFKWLKRQRRKNRRRATEMRGDLLATGSPVELPKSTPNTGNTLPTCTPNSSVCLYICLSFFRISWCMGFCLLLGLFISFLLGRLLCTC